MFFSITDGLLTFLIDALGIASTVFSYSKPLPIIVVSSNSYDAKTLILYLISTGTLNMLSILVVWLNSLKGNDFSSINSINSYFNIA